MSLEQEPGSEAKTILPSSDAEEALSENKTIPPSPAEKTGGPGRLPVVPGYEILGELGRGGMGVVYKARQKKLKRLVALKMILAGGNARPEDVARFQAEAEAVARLQHPHIVQVHEVGEIDGCPFFSLEFVDGGSLATKLNGAPQPAREAAELVRILADAMHHAHQHGIIHRDLKPANVLMAVVSDQLSVVSSPLSVAKNQGQLTTDHGQLTLVPKITDFGLAKPVEGDSGLTKTGAILGTPSYMAPEQAACQQVGTAADVYALGAILYELLTGRPPFRAGTPLDTILQVLGEDPVPPSRLQPKLPRDLETICLKCLEKDAVKRYGSAEALSADLSRFLAGEPILARPIGTLGRMVKWARRRPAAAALVAVSGLALCVVGVVIAVSNIQLREQRDLAWEQKQIADRERDAATKAKEEADRQRQRAVIGFDRAREAVDQMLTRVGDEKMRDIPLLEELQRDLLEEALKFNKQFLQDQSADPVVRRETSRAYYRAGRIRGMLGQHAQAAEAYREAIALSRKLVAEASDQAGHRHELARSCLALGETLQEIGHYPEAEQAFDEAIGLCRALAAESGDAAVYRRDLATIHNDLGIVFATSRREDQAEKAFRQAAEFQEALVKEFPKEVEYRQELAKTYTNLANVFAETKRVADAEPAYHKAVAIQEQLVVDFPKAPLHQRSLAKAHFNLGLLLHINNRQPEAEKCYRQAIARYEPLVADYPRVPSYRFELAGNLTNLASALADMGQKTEVEQLQRRAVACFETLVADFPENRYYQSEMGRWLNVLAVTVADRHDWEEARRLVERAIRHQQTALKIRPGGPRYLKHLRSHFQTLAQIHLERQDHAAAAKAASSLAGTAEATPDDSYNAACFLAQCVPLALRDSELAIQDRQALSQRYADQAMDQLRQAVERGYKNADHMEKDADLDPLRSRQDFQKLLAELKTKLGIRN